MTDFWRSFFGSLALFSAVMVAAMLLEGCQTTQAPPVDLGPPPESIVHDEALPDAEEHETKEIKATPFTLGKEVSAPLGCKLNPEAC